ncbi:ATP-binding protein [Belnapia rosea]|uniref:ATP-binding protein n=1 Tax=Belnapia rosea TaxID=938405 RepID=UPI000889F7CB|nr:ATP-binding protein [Belnapia rosea]SDB38807.1 multi-sensor signal transduction histidine kinase [Belnapia rosea]
MNDRPTRTPPGTPNLATCEQEPIRIPGAVQPHGVLVAARKADLVIMAVSDNLGAISGIAAAAAVGTPLAALLDARSVANVAALLERLEPSASAILPVTLAGAADSRPCHALLHRHDGLAIIEIETPVAEPASAQMPGDLVPALSAAIERLQAARDPSALWAQAVREVRTLTGFDRVKLYRFHPDWTGEVVAEERADHMPGFMGLNFPASDIPAQARDLYVANPTRIIPDVGYVPVPLLVAAERGGVPIDLSYAQLRSVSPLHLEYLRNMGVGASMSVSVLRGGKLWGLIACHHRGPLRVGHDRRQACRLLAQVLAWQLAVAEEASVARHSAAVRALQARVLEDTARGRDHRQAILRHANDLLGLMDAGGFALVTPEAVTLVGTTPDEDAVRDLTRWLIGREDAAASFETDRLGSFHPPAQGFADVASGVLAVPLSRPPRQMMLWFRPEVAQTVTWGGDPRKPVELSAQGPGRLTPRHSFAEWREAVSGRSRIWQPHELVAAGELRDLVLDVLVRRAEELELINSQLARSNEELEAFAYVASHDIREPLRQIETFASLLERAVGGANVPQAGRIGRWVEGIEASSRRLRTLIDDLTEFSRLGRHAQPMAPTPLGEALVEAENDLSQAIAECGAAISAEDLPVVLCDRSQIRVVLQNLLSNAIKYRAPDRTPRIVIAATPEPADRAPRGRPMLRVTVTDNGIGFDPRYAERIFEPFQRLHSADRFPGSGIGLATCRKIIDRHGGTIGAEGRPGEGTTIWFTLRAAPEAMP